MAACIWHKVAAFSGVAAVGAGTYGSHGLKPKDPIYKASWQLFDWDDEFNYLASNLKLWQTGNFYHLIHTSALLAAPMTKRPNLFGSLLTFGIVAFSGTLYVVAKTEDRKLGKAAPFGGMAFMAAWATLLF